MRLTPRTRSTHLIDVDITGMIDVVFLLIIFFMTTAQFARMTRAEINLPDEKGEEVKSQLSPGIVVNMARDGSIIVDQQVISINALVRMVAAEFARGAASGDVELTVRADQDSPARMLNEIARALADAGLRGVRLATEPPRGGGS